MARATTRSSSTGRSLILCAVVLATGSCNPEHGPTHPRTLPGSPSAAIGSGVVANPGGPYTGVEGTAIAFDGTASQGTGLKYNWDFGDGTRDSVATPSHAYADNKTFTVKLTVTDVNGVKSTAAQTSATVANVPPVVAALTAPAVAPRAGAAVNLSTTFTDAGTADKHTGTFAWGDTRSTTASIRETKGSGTASGSHSYAAAGTYTVSLRVADDNGGADTVSLVLAVGPKNQAPTAAPGGPYAGSEGSAVSFNGTGSADPDGDALKYDWNFGDTSPHDTTSATPTHIYADNGTFTVTLIVTDSYGAKSAASQTTATISNAVPVITSFTGPATTPVAGAAMTVNASFTDAGTRDTHSATFDWGDAASSAGTITESGGSGSVTGTHTYAAAGQYTVRLRLSDNAGAVDTATLDILVDPSSAPQVGALTVTTATSGADLDPDGYTVAVDGGAAQPIAINGTVTIGSLSAGSHTVALAGLASNCTTTNNPRTVSVTAGATTTSSFAVSCTAISTNPGAIAITTTTVGLDLDPDGYMLFVDSGTAQALSQGAATNGTTTVSGVSVGAHTVTIAGLAGNCSIGNTQQPVSVTAGQTSRAGFAVFCMAVHASTYTFVGAGDIADCARTDDELTANVLDRIVADSPGAVVYTIGDNVYDASTATELANCYDPNWGRQKVRTFATLGNHEYKIDPNPTWDYFGSRAGPRGLGYYSYDIGDYWHVIVLNDNVSYGGPARAAGSPQDQWLQADLAANTKPCIIAMWHQPMVASDNWYSASRKIYWDRLYAARADIVLNGHLHFYERAYPQTPDLVHDDANGIRQIIVGTGGASTYTPDILTKNTVVVAPSRGVLKLTLGPGTYSWEFVWATGQTFSDSGSGTCH